MRGKILPTFPTLETDSIRAHSAPEWNVQLDEKTEQQLRWFSTQSEEAISQRIQSLENEWDLERCIEINAGIVSLTGMALGLAHSRKWFLLPAIALPLLIQTGWKGWSRPVNWMRRWGVRSRREIEAEKYSLKYLRGDFDHLKDVYEKTLKAVEAFKACRK